MTDFQTALSEWIDRLLRDGKPRIIAIDGRCASGKTTLAEALGRHYHCNVIHMDHFFLRTPCDAAFGGKCVRFPRAVECRRCISDGYDLAFFGLPFCPGACCCADLYGVSHAAGGLRPESAVLSRLRNTILSDRISRDRDRGKTGLAPGLAYGCAGEKNGPPCFRGLFCGCCCNLRCSARGGGTVCMRPGDIL